MVALTCTHKNRAKHGKDRNGNQRWKCRDCGATFTSNEVRPLGDMRTDLERAALVLKMLLEGMSIRAASRISGMKVGTICDLIIQAGENCDRFLRQYVRGVHAAAIELDEIWDFIGCKAKTAELKGYRDERGDSWTWLAIDADTKMILSYAVGKRDEGTGREFLDRLNYATEGRCQVTADGLAFYTNNVPLTLGSRVDFAQLIKSYASSQDETRYSPAKITGIEKVVRFGNPDENRISTSYAERLNLSVRMHVRRFTRLTNAHSKSYRHHEAMVALFAAWYCLCRRHETIGKTPAMACGLTDQRMVRHRPPRGLPELRLQFTPVQSVTSWFCHQLQSQLLRAPTGGQESPRFFQEPDKP
jgi:transposase-like protein/IS1 family transposase